MQSISLSVGLFLFKIRLFCFFSGERIWFGKMKKCKGSSSTSLGLRLLLLFLAFSMVLSRTLKSTSTDKQWIQVSEEKQGKFLGFFEGNEFNLEGRMEIETEDYTGTGANKNHDPKPPGSD